MEEAVIRRVGVDPRSRGTRAFFLAYGVVWLGTAGAPWYLPFGTLMSGLQLAILASLARSRA